MKPIVLYDVEKGGIIPAEPDGVSRSYVYPIDHPSPEVSNAGFVWTSPVVAHDITSGVFETRNTIYKPGSL